MKKTLKFLYIIFVSIICFCMFSKIVKAEEVGDTIDCSGKLLRCFYPIEISNRKYSMECYYDANNHFGCKLYCKENCSNWGYYIKQEPEEKRFSSSGKYVCPSSLTYRTVSDSSDKIYFKKLDKEDPTYENLYKSITNLGEHGCENTGSSTGIVPPTQCGCYGDNAFNFSVSSTKNQDGSFSYQAKYVVASPKGEYEITNINEVMKSKKTDKNGCPQKPFTLYSIVLDGQDSNGNPAYKIELTSPTGKEGTLEFGEYSGWDGWDPEKGWGDNLTRQGHITVNNIFEVVTNRITCSGALSNTLPILRDIFKYIRLAAALLFLALTSFDYVKAIADSDSSLFKKANQRIVKRAIILVVIIILPSIINLVLAIVQLSNGACEIN